MSNKPLYLQGRGRGRGRGDGRGSGQSAAWKQPHVGGRNGGRSSAAPTKTAEDTFKEISAKHQEQAKKHLQRHGSFSSDEEDEDGENNEEIMGSLLQSFSGNDGQGDGVTDLGRTQEFLLNSFKSASNVCLICIESIKKNEAIWSCHGCYCMFHIPCIQKWVKEGVYQQTALSEENFPNRDLPWFCPKCRFEYTQSQCPTKYLCFCGKEQDPKFDPWLVPHSCGQKCNKPLKPNCGHTCLLLCHPGPCPPCPKTVQVKCYCGKTPSQTKRCGSREWSCGQLCGQPLSCGHHKCKTPCHKDGCPPCPEVSQQPCQCGNEKMTRPCAVPEWECKKVCNQVLSCGIHICEEICHDRKASHKCPREGERACPCGKTKVSLPCTEDVPTCGDTCGKLLECGQHECAQRCHTGPCGVCRQMIIKKCRCGARKKEVPCCKEYLCETKCTKIKDCGKHKCNRKCCDDNCPPCEQQCTKSLRCRNHKCSSRCHTGPCYPCPLTVDIKCNCGATCVTVPCGREKITKPPRCKEPCRTPPDCHHPARDPHRCHFGRCPPCRQVCLKPLTPCDHPCPMMCHTAVLTKVQEKRTDPWERQPEPRMEVINHPCPPCQFPIPVTCLGKHETAPLPCSQVRPVSCGRPCGRLLPCCNHTCALQCHEVKGATENTMAGQNCQVCEEHCSKPRPQGCTHDCPLPCHPGECPPCTQMIRMRCHCKLVLQHVECHKWNGSDEKRKEMLQACPSRCPKFLTCSHQCTKTCHPGDCHDSKECTEKTKVRCPCRRKSKTFPCSEVQSGKIKLECDNFCKEHKEKQQKLKQEEDAAKKAEELRKQQEELEEYERKFKGKKQRKPRKQKEVEEVIPIWKRYGKYAGLSVLIGILSIFIYYLLMQ